MRILLDTSILVAAMVQSHPAHTRAFVWLRRVLGAEAQGFVAAHSVAETYAVLTTLPIQPRVTPLAALQLIQRNILSAFAMIVLDEANYKNVIARLASAQVSGGAVYDGLILEAAVKANAEQIVTLNERDFRRVYPALSDRIVAA